MILLAGGEINTTTTTTAAAAAAEVLGYRRRRCTIDELCKSEDDSVIRTPRHRLCCSEDSVDQPLA